MEDTYHSLSKVPSQSPEERDSGLSSSFLTDHLLGYQCSNPECSQWYEVLLHQPLPYQADFSSPAASLPSVSVCQICRSIISPVYDYYGLFQLSHIGVRENPHEFLETLKKNYKIISLRFHPDRNQDSSESANIFNLVQAAYQTLNDEDLREEYGHQLAEYDQLTQQDIISLYLENTPTDLPSDYTSTNQSGQNPFPHPNLAPGLESQKPNFDNGQPTKTVEEKPARSITVNQANLIAGAILGVVVGLGLLYLTGERIWAFLSLLFSLSLALTWRKLFLFTMELLEVGVIILSLVFIVQGQLIAGFLTIVAIFGYYLKLRKKIFNRLPTPSAENHEA